MPNNRGDDRDDDQKGNRPDQPGRASAPGQRDKGDKGHGMGHGGGHGGRPSNEDLFNRPPQIEPGCESALQAVQSALPDAKILEAKKSDGNNFEVTAGYQDDQGTHIVEFAVNSSGNIIKQEERPVMPPGQAKKQGQTGGDRG